MTMRFIAISILVLPVAARSQPAPDVTQAHSAATVSTASTGSFAVTDAAVRKIVRDTARTELSGIRRVPWQRVRLAVPLTPNN